MHSYYITPEQYDTAEKNGIKKATLENRVFSLDWTAERACTQPTRKPAPLLEPIWHEKAAELGVSVECLRLRVRNGWSLDKALTTPKVRGRQDYDRKHKADDVAKAKANGISYEMYVRRRNSGWSVEKACTTPIMSRQEASRLSAMKRRRPQNIKVGGE